MASLQYGPSVITEIMEPASFVLFGGSKGEEERKTVNYIII